MREALEAEFQMLDGAAGSGQWEFKWMDPGAVRVAQWVRAKCTFGCDDFGQRACCPPNSPSVDDCARFFSEYSEACMFRFRKGFDRPEDRYDWSRDVNRALLELERAAFFAGHERAFVLFMDCCRLCKKCVGQRSECKHPFDGRPSLESFAVDVFSTVRDLGWPIRVLSDYSQEMNRYGLLLIE
jgi:predicted metal-binding protein